MTRRPKANMDLNQEKIQLLNRKRNQKIGVESGPDPFIYFQLPPTVNTMQATQMLGIP